MKNLKINRCNALYLVLVALLIANQIISKVQWYKREELHRSTIEFTYRKAWIDGANSLINNEWDSPEEGMKYYRKDSLIIVGLLYGN